MKTEAEIREKLAILGRDRLFLRGWGGKTATPIMNAKLELLEWVLE